MVDSIGRMPMGRSSMGGRKRKFIRAKVTRKMEQWRDKARINIIEQRRRYKAKVERNERQMAEKKEAWEKSLNPSAFSLMSKYRNRLRLTHSTIPLRPMYSKVKPKERIYGNKWKKFENKARKSQALRKNQSKNGIVKALLKKKKEYVKRE